MNLSGLLAREPGRCETPLKLPVQTSQSHFEHVLFYRTSK